MSVKELTPAQAKALLKAALNWQSQGSRSKYTTSKTLKLWDVVEKIKTENTRVLCTEGVPIVGQDVYVPGSAYIGYGQDFAGGRVEVIGVRLGQCGIHQVKVEAGGSYAWEGYLQGMQEELAERYKDQRGHPDPLAGRL